MVRSFAIKTALLGMTLLLIAWIGWPASEEHSPPDGPERTDTALPASMEDMGADSAPDAGLAAVAALVPRAPVNRSVTPPTSRPRVVDVNRASLEELMRLPGVGPALAQRILDQRTAQGRFQRVEDLLVVKGIGKKRLAQLNPLVRVQASAGEPPPQKGPAGRRSREKAL